MNISLADFIAFHMKNVMYFLKTENSITTHTFLHRDNSNIKIVSMNICRLIFHILNSRNKIETVSNVRYYIGFYFFFPQISI